MVSLNLAHPVYKDHVA